MTSACNSYKTQNHPKPSTTTYNHPRPSTTFQKQSQSPKTSQKNLQWPKNQPKLFTTTQNYKQKTHYFAQKLNTVKGYHKSSAEKSEKSIQTTGWANRETIHCQKVELESYVVIYFAKFALLAYFKMNFKACVHCFSFFTKW